jgi:hypothetical protein
MTHPIEGKTLGRTHCYRYSLPALPPVESSGNFGTSSAIVESLTPSRFTPRKLDDSILVNWGGSVFSKGLTHLCAKAIVVNVFASQGGLPCREKSGENTEWVNICS